MPGQGQERQLVAVVQDELRHVGSVEVHAVQKDKTSLVGPEEERLLEGERGRTRDVRRGKQKVPIPEANDDVGHTAALRIDDAHGRRRCR